MTGSRNAVITDLKNDNVPAKKIPTTGQDATAQGMAWILEGYQCGSVYKPVYKEAQDAVAMADILLSGNTVPAALLNGTTIDPGQHQHHRAGVAPDRDVGRRAATWSRPWSRMASTRRRPSAPSPVRRSAPRQTSRNRLSGRRSRRLLSGAAGSPFGAARSALIPGGRHHPEIGGGRSGRAAAAGNHRSGPGDHVNAIDDSLI